MAMTNEICNLEGKFRIINSQIEAKTAEYLKKADEIVRNQEQSLEDFICNVTSNDNACGDSIKINEKKLIYGTDSESPLSESESLPVTPRISRNNSSSIEGRINFFTKISHNQDENKNDSSLPIGPKIERESLMFNVLKTKLKEMKVENIKKTEQIKKKNVECEAMKKSNQKLQDEKIKLCSQINQLKIQNTKYEGKIVNFTDKLQAKETQCKVLLAENEMLNKAAKELKQNIARLEVRLTRTLEDVAVLTEQLSNAKLAKKELAESSKKKMDELTDDLEKTKKKNQNTISALVKQAQLIDNLKRQIVFLKTGKEVKNVDERLDSLLQWNV